MNCVSMVIITAGSTVWRGGQCNVGGRQYNVARADMQKERYKTGTGDKQRYPSLWTIRAVRLQLVKQGGM